VAEGHMPAAGLRNGQFEFAVSYSSHVVAVKSVAGGGLGFAAAPSMELEDVFGPVERAVKLAKAAGRVRKSPVALSEGGWPSSDTAFQISPWTPWSW